MYHTSIMIILTKIFSFNAAHRYHNPSWTDEENVVVFGEDNHLHGHNYELEVSVTGPIDSDTGFIVDLGYLKEVVQEHVISKIDHRQIEVDIDWFADKQPSCENLVLFIWQQLAGRLTGGVDLARIRLYETPTIFAEITATDLD